MNRFTLTTVLFLLTDLCFIFAISAGDNHWIVKRRILLGRDRPKARYAW